MNYCIYLSKKINGNFRCKKKKSDIVISECSNCKFKQLGVIIQNKKIKSRTIKQSKIERNRFSILTSDLSYCIICGAKKESLHEVFFGRSRQLSIKYGLVIPLCNKCHTEMHKNVEWQEYWHKKGQTAFITNYPNLNFLSIFRKNYL